ncbi:NADPH oxidase organizer 1b [Scleropages formosus]|nr:NADPH oxidase organizer 1-like [Scleropages formosus]
MANQREQRFPASVRLIGVMHKGPSRVFMTSVFWSDQTEIIVYRSFQEFKKLHKRLKKKFPPENPFRRSDRVLPSFRAKTIKNNFQKKGPSKSVLRLKSLEKYCGELLSCDPNVAQSAEVVQFFLPQNRDLEPDYGKNSFVIMPSDDPSEGEASNDGKRHSMGNITQPFVAETYRCVAPYETKDTKNRPFSIAVNEAVDVLIKDKAGWWLVENDEKRLAWFPAPFLETCEDDEEDEEDEDEGALFCVVRNFQSSKDDELSVNIGSKVQVLQKSDNGWWLVRHHGKAGYVPSMYLQPYTNPHVRLQAVQKDMRSSSLCLAQLHFSEPRLQETLQLPPNNRKESCPRPSPKQRSRSMELLSESLGSSTPPISEELPGPKSHPSTDSEGSEGSEFSFSDDISSSGIDSVGASRSDGEEPSCAPQAEPHGGRRGSNPQNAPSPPKMPPRPRPQEIFSRCTTITRKAALTYKANLFAENVQSRVR